MASVQVVVRVCEGTSVVEEAVRRPVRLTPDGFAGVVYAGAVYPLRIGNQVDLSGPSWEMEDCNRFLLGGAAIPYAGASGAQTNGSDLKDFGNEWNVETNAFGHYVVFNAPERLAAVVVDSLERAGLHVQRWDVSHRPASDGKFYDWFARLRIKASHDEVVARVVAAFTQTKMEPPEASEAGSVALRLEEMEAQVEKLLDQVSQLQDRIASAEALATTLQSTLDRGVAREAALTRDLGNALIRQRMLHDNLEAIRSSVEQAPTTRALLDSHAVTEELLEMALAENASLREEMDSLDRKTVADGNRLLVLESNALGLQQRLDEIGEQDRERRRSSEAKLAPRKGVEGFLGEAFARLSFVLESLEILADFESPVAALRVLVQIDMGEVLGKDLVGIRGWREVSKVATGIAGSEDMGRIYYKPDGERVLVSVHLKHDDKEQRRHVDRLRSL